MKNATNRWLDKLAEADEAKGGTGSDYRLAELLGIERQRVSRYRRGADKVMGDDIAVALAEQLGIHPMIVVADIGQERARSEREKKFWIRAASGLAKAAIVAAPLAVALSSAAVPFPVLC